jgi:acyl-coenzyme A thioesterase PaaI-like protein
MGSTIAAAALLADDALGLATTGAMPLGSLAVSVELTIDAVGPVPDAPTTLVARAEARTVDSDGGVGTGTIADGSGREFALVSVRSIQSRKLDTDQIFTEAASDDFVPPPLAEPLRGTPALANGSGLVHGGVIAIAGIGAAEQALQPLVTTGVRIFYARPIPADGREIRTGSTAVHRGRRAGLAHVEVGSVADDAVAAWLTVTAVGKATASNQGGSDD